MAIFNNSDTQSSAKTDSNTTIITTGSKITGEMHLTCNLYIDGELEGSIDSTKEINIGKNGQVKGNLTTEHLIVQGYFEGTIDASLVEIKSEGRVNGEIISKELIIESKGIFEGKSVLKDTQAMLEKLEK